MIGNLSNAELWKRMGLESLSAGRALLNLNDEGHLRSAISRFYYAGYCLSTSKLYGKCFGRDRRNPSHKQLPNLIETASSLSLEHRKLVKKQLSFLRRSRESADYAPGQSLARPDVRDCLRAVNLIRDVIEGNV